MLNRQEQNELVESITRSIEPRPKKPKRETKPEERDEEKLVPEIPLDKVLPPSFGHKTGLLERFDQLGVPDYKGGLHKESLEERLFKLLEGIDDSDQKSSVSANQSADVHGDNRSGQSQVGTTEVLGHSKAGKTPATSAKAQQQENSPFAKRGKVGPNAAETEEDDDKEAEDKLRSAFDLLEATGALRHHAEVKLLHLLEGLCHDCDQKLTVDDIQVMRPGEPELCKTCYSKYEKKRGREREEEVNTNDRINSAEDNLLDVSMQMPDRGYDKDRGTPGWLMGEFSPGRSF